MTSTDTQVQTPVDEVREIVEFAAVSARKGSARAAQALAADAEKFGFRHAISWYAEDAVKAEWQADLWTRTQANLERARVLDEVKKALAAARADVMRTLTDTVGFTNQFTVGAKTAERAVAADALEMVEKLIALLAS